MNMVVTNVKLSTIVIDSIVKNQTDIIVTVVGQSSRWLALVPTDAVAVVVVLMAAVFVASGIQVWSEVEPIPSFGLPISQR